MREAAKPAPRGEGRIERKVGAPQRKKAAHTGQKSADSRREPALDPISKRLASWTGNFESQPQGPSHLRGLLVHVADQSLEFSRAIWFMLERNTVKGHVNVCLQVGLNTEHLSKCFVLSNIGPPSVPNA